MSTPGSRCTVSGADAPLVHAIARHLKKMGIPGSVCKFDSLPAGLGPGRDGLLVLAAATVADAREIPRRVQEIVLQQWPVAVLVTATEAAAAFVELRCLQGHIAGYFQWPREAGRLADCIGARLRGVCRSRPAPEPPLPGVICRDFLGATPALWPMAEALAAAAAQDVNVLITGETGTGKSFLARVIHGCSPRKGQRLVVVPCGALAPSLIESELFGHTRGAFTGAGRARAGRFASAGKGTLLLDEVEALGLAEQAKLLQVIETGEFEPVGSTRTQVCAARIMAASNVDLEEAVRAARFRSDLYYRLAGLVFHLPPLRERPGDIPRLAGGMVARFNHKFRKGLFAVSPEVMAVLQSLPWPGNLRELENALMHAVLLSAGPDLLVEHLPPAYRTLHREPMK